MSYGLSLKRASTAALALPTDPVRLIMTDPPATVDVAVSLRDAAEQLAAEEIGALLVTGDGALGIISERDVASVVAASGSLDLLQAGDAMNTDLVWSSPNTSIWEAGRLMLDAGVRHLPVGDGHTAAGIVSIRDVLAVVLQSPPKI
jgi:CBS domain-containing protein